ncbi:MAG: TIGR02453 family protein [Saprospiraceae bacterium]|nr:MAG: TIGR02453 family protein [Saprospiraceae bacterium]
MKIQKATLQFLKDLSNNNDRDWFQANKETYEAAQKNMKAFVKAVEDALSQTDHLEGSKLFRIYRDVRFSKDKSPYKNNFGMGFTRATNRLRGGYYLHIEPGASFVGGGFWRPNSSDLKRIRDEFVADDKPIRKIIADPTFQKYFGSLHGDELKTAPRGYDKDSPVLDLIRKKSFTIHKNFTDKEVTSDNFLLEVKATFEAMRPYFDYMSMVLTTDMNGESILD